MSGKDLGSLKSLLSCPVYAEKPLSELSTWRIGGLAALVVEPRGPEEAAAARRWAVERGVPCIVIGAGSNLLFDDRGFEGVVIHIGNLMSNTEIREETVRAQAGVWMPSLARQTASSGLSGLEHTVGIPGTLGGLIVMNGGSLRRTIGEVTLEVGVVDDQGSLRWIPGQECGFAYRHSRFQGSSEIVVGAVLKLSRGERREIRHEMVEVLRSRRSKFPLRNPNCGSVFKSDPATHERLGPPGMIIEQAGLKGWRVGGIEVSPKHANFFVNRGGGRALDALELIRRVRARIFELTGHWLESEVKFVRCDGRTFPASEACEQ